jgi:hypothetical protein
MKRFLAVVVLAAALMSGCRAADRAGPAPAAPGDPPASTPAVDRVGTAPPKPAGAPKGGDTADPQLDEVDGLLGQLDDQANRGDQSPPDAD